MRIIANISRILTGLLFVFSGFVKGVDPLGFSYKLEDYFIAYHIELLIPLALYFTIGLCTLEFIIGIMLLFKIRMKLTSWLLLLMMIYFTCLTFFDAIYNPVPDCGCFGDAIKLTNWQTFYKNVVLILLAIIVFRYRKKFSESFSISIQWSIALLFAILFAGFSTYCYLHLPVIDFTEWKIGNKLFSEKPLPVKYYLSYRDKSTGEVKEFLSPDYPYEDSTWMAGHEFVSQRVEDPNEYDGKSLVIMDTLQAVVTESIIRNPGFQLIVNSYDLNTASIKAFQDINAFAGQLATKNVPVAVLVSSESGQIATFTNTNQLNLDFYVADDILLKTMVRSNPGIMLLKGGVIINKWHWRDLPSAEEFLSRYPQTDAQ